MPAQPCFTLVLFITKYASHHPILYARGAAEGPDIRAFAASAAGEARELAQEWTEQRSIFHSRLYDQCIRPPLQVGFQGFIEVHMLWGMARLAEGHTGGSKQLPAACCGISLQRPRRSGLAGPASTQPPPAPAASTEAQVHLRCNSAGYASVLQRQFSGRGLRETGLPVWLFKP